MAQARLNLNFINYIVEPLWRILAQDYLPHLQQNMAHIQANIRFWQSVIDRKAAEDAAAAAAAAGPAPAAEGGAAAAART